MLEVREVLRAWLSGAGPPTATERAGVDRKTSRRYVAAGEAADLTRDGGEGRLSDELIAAVVAAVRPARPSGRRRRGRRLDVRITGSNAVFSPALLKSPPAERLKKRLIISSPVNTFDSHPDLLEDYLAKYPDPVPSPASSSAPRGRGHEADPRYRL